MKYLVTVCVASILAVTGCSSAKTPTQAPDDQVQASSFVQYEQMLGDWKARYVACVRRTGVDAKILDNGAISPAYAPGRKVSAEGLDAECQKEAGPTVHNPPPDDNFKKGRYVLAKKTAECLKQHGFSVTEPPSLEQYMERFSEPTNWDPYTDVINSHGDISRAMGLCPEPKPVEIEEAGKDT